MWKSYLLMIFVLVVSGCASSDNQQAEFDKSLYSGKPIEALTNDEPPQTEEEAISRGDAALTNNNVDLALYEYLRSMTFSDAKHKDKTLYTVGRIHLAKNDYQLADRAFRAALEQNPNHIGSLEELGKLNSKQGRSDIGESYYLRAINADQLRLGGTPNMDSNNINAENMQNLRFDDNSPIHAYIGLGVLLDIEGQHQLAQTLLNRALDINTFDVNALISIGYSYYMSEDYERARYYTNLALKQKPNDEKAINNLALIAIAHGEPRQALSIFNRHMTEPEALNSVGYLLILKGEPGEAIPYLQQAINKSPAYYAKANENLERALEMIRKERDTSKVIL